MIVVMFGLLMLLVVLLSISVIVFIASRPIYAKRGISYLPQFRPSVRLPVSQTRALFRNIGLY